MRWPAWDGRPTAAASPRATWCVSAPPGRKQHVGIYLGRNECVHASANRGVMISGLDAHYWRRSFWTARRVLD